MATNMDQLIRLREVLDQDLPIFFSHQQDAEAVYMAAFTSKDPSDEAAFTAHWERIRASEQVTIQTILCGDEVAGHVASFTEEGDRELTYWIGREHWGRGVATAALASFLGVESERPLYARAAKDNFGSIRVLEKCGFVLSGEETGFANARGKEIEEVVLKLAGGG